LKIQSIALGIVAILIIAGGLVAVQADKGGNGAPSGYHYTLNILGKNWERGENVMDNNGNRIFVRLGSQETMCKTKIMLRMAPEGEDFDVIDADGTDGIAEFQLPKPYKDDDTEFLEPAYQVWIRVQSPKGYAEMYTTFLDNEGVTWVKSDYIITLDQTGRKTFKQYTKELTTITADLDDDGNKETVGLFGLSGWWAWDYDNWGLKHIQIRFYPMDYPPV